MTASRWLSAAVAPLLVALGLWLTVRQPDLWLGTGPAVPVLAGLCHACWRVYQGDRPQMPAATGTVAVAILIYAYGVLAFLLLLTAMGLFSSFLRFQPHDP